MSKKRALDELDRQSIRDQLADGGLPRERIAAEARVNLKQVDAIRAPTSQSPSARSHSPTTNYCSLHMDTPEREPAERD